VINQKYLAHFAMIVYFLVISFAPLLGLEHNLYKYGVTTNYTYSDMNGFGPFLTRVRIFEAYWATAAVLLAVVAYLFWVRGTTTDRRGRLLLLRRRFTPAVAAVTGVAAI